MSILKIRFVLVFCLTFGLFFSTVHANDLYPKALNDGDWVIVSGRQGVAWYAVRSSVNVEEYNPPYYQIAMEIVTMNFPRVNNREGEPYVTGKNIARFRYNWDRKVIYTGNPGDWHLWNHHDSNALTTAGGWPKIPCSAEVAFITAYNMRFYDKTLGANGYRVISEEFYNSLGI